MKRSNLRKWMNRGQALMLAALIALLGSGAGPLNAVSAAAGSTFVVNSTADAPDADPSNGICAAAGGACTLRAAIMEANFTPIADTITLPAGVFLLTRTGFDDVGLVGDLDISASLTIQGAGAGVSIVDGNGAVTGDRVFDVLQSASVVTLAGMTIRNGHIPGSGGGTISWGGGIRVNNVNATSLTINLNNDILENNFALTGAGLYASTASVNLSNSIVRNNTTDSGGSGGGMFVGFGGVLTILDSSVNGNSGYNGGGISLEGVLDTHIERSEIYSNMAAGSGGGIYNITDFANPASPLTVLDSSLHNNSAAFSGGGISTVSLLAILRTTLDANHAAIKGGGIFSVPASNSPLSIRESTLSHNTAQFGGGIEIEGSPGTTALTLVNSTLSGNSVSHDGGGIYAISAAKVNLYNVTIATNILSRVHLQTNLMRGGGVFSDSSFITAQNTLIADNYYTDNLTTATKDDCFTAVNTLNSLGYNLIETVSNCAISGTTFGNITGLDPKLGPLWFNFGQTQTQALLLGSPAIDAGQQPACTEGAAPAISTDQRGLARPLGPRCDIGAVEYTTIYPSYLPLVDR